MKRLALLVAAGAAAASFSTPASADVPPICFTERDLVQCVKDMVSVREICIPSGDLEDDCRLGG